MQRNFFRETQAVCRKRKREKERNGSESAKKCFLLSSCVRGRKKHIPVYVCTCVRVCVTLRVPNFTRLVEAPFSRRECGRAKAGCVSQIRSSCARFRFERNDTRESCFNEFECLVFAYLQQVAFWIFDILHATCVLYFLMELFNNWRSNVNGLSGIFNKCFN